MPPTLTPPWVEGVMAAEGGGWKRISPGPALPLGSPGFNSLYYCIVGFFETCLVQNSSQIYIPPFQSNEDNLLSFVDSVKQCSPVTGYKSNMLLTNIQSRDYFCSCPTLSTCAFMFGI